MTVQMLLSCLFYVFSESGTACRLVLSYSFWLGKRISLSIWCSTGGTQGLTVDGKLKFEAELRYTLLPCCDSIWEQQ